MDKPKSMRPAPTQPDWLLERFDELGQWLKQWRALWHPNVFSQRTLAWEHDYPELSSWLRGLDDEAIALGQRDISALAVGAPAPLGRLAQQRGELIQALERPLAAQALPELDHHHMKLGIGGRKWSQIEAFAATFEAHRDERCERLLDWCGGYGHLGRTLASHAQAKLRIVELREDLSHRARSRAQQLQVELDYQCADALNPQTARALDDVDAAVALHACGELGNALLRAGVTMNTPWMALVPCCPHILGPDRESFAPMSAAGRAHELGLDRQALRAAVLEEVFTHAPEINLKRKEKAWRLALDELVREATGEDRYFSVGPLSDAYFRGSFLDFIEAMTARFGYPLPADFSPKTQPLRLERLETRGVELERQVRALELWRALFRRPLELWLLLDRATWLIEQGRAVWVGTFCERALTPRNLAIITAAHK